MPEQPTTAQAFELDRALLDEHGPSYIDTICLYADGMRAEGRVADADDAMRQCDRMRAILLPDAELLAAYKATEADTGHHPSDTLCNEIERRHLDT